MKKLFKSVLCLLTFVVGGVDVGLAVKIKNMTVPVYITVGVDNVVGVTRDSNKAADFVFGYMGEKPNKSMMIMLNNGSDKILGWTSSHELVVLPLTTEISPDMFMWRHNSQDHTLCEHSDAEPLYLSLDDGSFGFGNLSLRDYFDDFAQWVFVKNE